MGEWVVGEEGGGRGSLWLGNGTAAVLRRFRRRPPATADTHTHPDSNFSTQKKKKNNYVQL